MSFRRINSFAFSSSGVLRGHSVQDAAALLATTSLVKQFVQEGVTVDDRVRNELEIRVKLSISKLMTAGRKPPTAKELANEALGITNITSLKLQARKSMMQARKLRKMEMHTTKKWFIINQNDYRKIIWDLFCVFLLVYSIFEMPFSLSFREGSGCAITWIELLNLFVDCCFCVDCGLSFITSYVDPETGIAITSPLAIVKRSCRTPADSSNARPSPQCVIPPSPAQVRPRMADMRRAD